MRSYTPSDYNSVPPQATKVFSGEIFEIYQWEQEQFDGSTKTFEMAKRPDTVDIIAVHDGKIVLSHERQPHTGEYYCLPAGMHDHAEEDELAAAQRELREETGYIFKTWKLISVKQAGGGKLDQLIYTFLATDLDRIEDQQLDPGEEITPEVYSFDELKRLKYDPKMRYYPLHVLDDLESLDELLSLPALHDYDN